MKNKRIMTVINEQGQQVEPNLMQQHLLGRGWSQYYHHDYWVNRKTVENHHTQDYTNYGYTLQEAMAFERGYDKAKKDFKIFD